MEPEKSILFDVKEQFDKEAAESIATLYSIAKKYNIPLLVAACVRKSSDEQETVGTAFLPGPERTPDTYAIASKFLLEGKAAGMHVVQQFYFQDALNKIQVEI